MVRVFGLLLVFLLSSNATFLRLTPEFVDQWADQKFSPDGDNLRKNFYYMNVKSQQIKSKPIELPVIQDDDDWDQFITVLKVAAQAQGWTDCSYGMYLGELPATLPSAVREREPVPAKKKAPMLVFIPGDGWQVTYNPMRTKPTIAGVDASKKNPKVMIFRQTVFTKKARTERYIATDIKEGTSVKTWTEASAKVAPGSLAKIKNLHDAYVITNAATTAAYLLKKKNRPYGFFIDGDIPPDAEFFLQTYGGDEKGTGKVAFVINIPKTMNKDKTKVGWKVRYVNKDEEMTKIGVSLVMIQLYSEPGTSGAKIEYNDYYNNYDGYDYDAMDRLDRFRNNRHSRFRNKRVRNHFYY